MTRYRKKPVVIDAMTTPSKPPSVSELIGHIEYQTYADIEDKEKAQKIDTILQAAWDEYNEHGGCGCLFCHAIDTFKED